MPIGKRLELLREADEKPNRFVIEDDYDSELKFTGKPIPSLQGIDTAGKVVYIGTFSRSIVPYPYCIFGVASSITSKISNTLLLLFPLLYPALNNIHCFNL